MTALPVAMAAPRSVTIERRGFLSGRTTPMTPKASGRERAEPDCGTGCRRGTQDVNAVWRSATATILPDNHLMSSLEMFFIIFV